MYSHKLGRGKVECMEILLLPRKEHKLLCYQIMKRKGDLRQGIDITSEPNLGTW